MSRPTLLLSDLHLPNTPSPLRQAFLAFLAGPARTAAAVWILGDLFEVWIGDAEGLADYAEEAAALRALTTAGVPVAFMAGNRDFMLGRRFAEAAGLRRVDDPIIVTLDGVPTLLGHGDRWCTDDLAYQRWRAFSRNPLAQAVYRRLPQRWRAAVAGTARKGSSARQMRPEILDVSPAAIDAAFRQAGVRRMIHGHTHRPAAHHGLIDGQPVERIVLADWRPGRCEYLEVGDGHMRRRRVAEAA